MATSTVQTTTIYVHKKTLDRVKGMVAMSDMFDPKHRPEIDGSVTSQNDTMFAVQVSGRPSDIAKLKLYARGLADAFHYCQ